MRTFHTDLTPWPGLAWRTWVLGGEATMVIGLRMWLIAMGGARAKREMRRMIEEKVIAFATSLAFGGAAATPAAIADRALGHYGGKVSANRRRLSKPR